MYYIQMARAKGGMSMERYSDKAIEIVNDLHTERLDYASEYIPLIDAAQQLAAYEDTGLIPEEFQQMRWIPVEERLPEKENAQVLMTDGEGCYISSRNNMVSFLDCEGIFIPGKAGAGVKVTHWMPLPKAPKEEKKND